jgi:archaellum component FlaC
MDNATWNLVLTGLLGLVSWILKDKASELKRLEILLNKTREEVAREYVTKVDVHNDINRVLDRIDRLENKLDAFLKDQRSALN